MTNVSANARGAIFMLVSMAGFAFNDGLLKLLAGDVPLYQAVLIRGLFVCLFLFLLAKAMRALPPWRVAVGFCLNKALVTRSLAEVGATVTFLGALFNMPIADVTAILQLLPLTTTLGAALIFGEQVGWRRYLVIFLGFFGVMLIIQPGTTAFNPWSIYVLAAVLMVTIRDLATRKMDDNIPSAFASLVSAICVTATALVLSMSEDWAPVDSGLLLHLAVTAGVLMIAYITSILAMRNGDIAFVTPFRYSVLLWAMLIGLLAFDEFPTAIQLLGSAIVVVSGIYAFYRERRALREVVENPSTV